MPEVILKLGRMAFLLSEVKREWEVDSEIYARSKARADLGDNSAASLRQTFEEIAEAHKIVEDAESKAGLRLIAQGAESVIIDSPHFRRRGLLVGINHRPLSLGRTREIFYTQRIMHTLFPHNFPTFPTTWGANNPNGVSGTIRQEIKEAQDTPIKYPLDEVYRTIEMLGLPVNLDRSYTNIMVGLDGEEYFVDVMSPKAEAGVWNMDKILGYMDDEHLHAGKVYSKGDRQQVRHAIERLAANNRRNN